MAASGTIMAALGHVVVDNSDVFSCGNVSSVEKPNGVYFGDNGGRNNKKGVLSMNVEGRNSGCKAIAFPVFDSLRMSGNWNKLIGGVSNGGCGSLSVRCYADVMNGCFEDEY
ncbi:hypothetical protein LIER_33955 [Lithospermum erythrorhizon]|uniref:Uncharacterized protein n=1 Tax=Lithospermum erythrorhizon TaxID=34254 RepID=A0AAV3RZL9_LITER